MKEDRVGAGFPGAAGTRPWDRIPRAKRGLDLFCLVLALPGLALVMAGIAALIKAVSPGPVFFVQERVGFRGRRFKCFKFRTMRPYATCASHLDHLRQLMRTDARMTKLDASGDPRLIPMGALLRATGLDELPQVFNVWRGEMSLVGPRPCTPYEYEDYREDQKERFNALPGLTGLWQVSGKNDTTFSEMIRLDIRYVRAQSVWLDLRIMAKTFGVLAEQVRRLRQTQRSTASVTDRVPDVGDSLAGGLG
jgi:lipopolysaccharide/colanic/teichoic acid biosynthesis glycosyltransferase